jgi:hypothetical protein
MPAVMIDSMLDDAARRAALYRGDLFVYSRRPSIMAFVEMAREMVEAAFAPLNPLTAQYEMPVEDYAALLARLKPAFIHDPRCKDLIPGILADLGCDPDETYFDLPRMRSSTSDDYLTTGIAYAFHPHRDTWYSAAPSQINWWMPVYDITRDNGMAFHPHYFDRSVKNNSEDYDYYVWNQKYRAGAAAHVKADTRVQPKPQEPMDLEPDIRVVSQPGGIMAFSAAQMHSSLPNRSGYTRFSIDFRVVNIRDVEARAGAPNVDSRCTGTALRDFLRCRDLERVPEALAGLYDEGAHKDEGTLIFQPATAG